MIERLEITNFRKFTRFSLRLRDGNILVGPNNAGKSSILDAFRLLDACLRHTRTRNPQLIEIKHRGVFDGYQIPDSVLPFSLANTTFNYSDEDAILEFYRAGGIKAVVRLHPDRQSRFFLDTGGQRLLRSSQFRRAFPKDLVVVPTLSPLETDERWVEDTTVQRNQTTRLASRVLRNVWLRKPNEDFAAFKADIESAWPSIQLQKPEMRKTNPPCVDMYYSENRIDREVQWAGFGFQVWMQILTHLRRGGPDSIAIIDEADIYLHPDLQRRLLRLIRERFGQFIIATHSVEMINDAEPHEVVSINNIYRSGRRIHTEGEYVSLYRYLGSTANADFARIARARKVIFVEGKDGRLLRRIAAQLGFSRLANEPDTPIVQLGGVTQWRRAAHAVWAFRQVLDIEVQAFCLFDRDYRCDAEIADFVGSALQEGLICRVLNCKELENYLLVPHAIQRAIWRRLRVRDPNVGELSG